MRRNRFLWPEGRDACAQRPRRSRLLPGSADLSVDDMTGSEQRKALSSIAQEPADSRRPSLMLAATRLRRLPGNLKAQVPR